LYRGLELMEGSNDDGSFFGRLQFNGFADQ
jgi:hypothetical protein